MLVKGDDLIQVDNRPLQKVIEVPSSKSYTNRLLILSSIYPSQVRIENYSKSTDVLHLIDCLKAVGLQIEKGPTGLVIHNSFPLCEKDLPDSGNPEAVVELEAGDGGTTNRFLIGLLSKGKRRYRVHAKGSMVNRPMEEFYHLLRQLKVRVESLGETPSQFFPVEIQGPAEFPRKKVDVDCSQSSQFISALALAYCDIKVDFGPVNLHASQEYFELTQKLIKLFYFEHFRRNMEFQVPIDFSSISYPVALALLTGKVVVKNCFFIDMLQPDSIFFSLIRKMGGDYKFNGEGLVVEKAATLKGLHWDCANCPDLVPTLVFLGAYAQGESVFTNLGSLDFKESRRMVEIQRILTQFQVAYEYDEERKTLYLRGNSPRAGVQELILPPDHRMIMMGYLFLRYNSGGVLSPGRPVNKSFENFFEVME